MVVERGLRAALLRREDVADGAQRDFARRAPGCVGAHRRPAAAGVAREHAVRTAAPSASPRFGAIARSMTTAPSPHATTAISSCSPFPAPRARRPPGRPPPLARARRERRPSPRRSASAGGDDLDAAAFRQVLPRERLRRERPDQIDDGAAPAATNRSSRSSFVSGRVRVAAISSCGTPRDACGTRSSVPAAARSSATASKSRTQVRKAVVEFTVRLARADRAHLLEDDVARYPSPRPSA